MPKMGVKQVLVFSQPTAVFCEKGSKKVYVTDTSNGRQKMITSVLALCKFLENLWKLLTVFQLTTDDVGGLDDTVAQPQAYSYLNEQLRTTTPILMNKQCEFSR